MLNRKSSLLTFSALLLVLAACDDVVQTQNETVQLGTAEQGTSSRVACRDPSTGALTTPEAMADCVIPEPAQVVEEPVIKQVEGGGESVETKGRFNQGTNATAVSNRMALIDPRTGKLVTWSHQNETTVGRTGFDSAKPSVLAAARREARPVEAPELKPVEGGGYSVNVLGMFRSPLVALRSEDGRIAVKHLED